MNDLGSDQGVPFDASVRQRHEFASPEVAAGEAFRLALPLIEAGLERGSEARFRPLDEVVHDGVEQFGDRFLYALEVATTARESSVFGFRDAVTPNGRLWAHRQAFEQVNDFALAWCGVDKGLLDWHRSRASAGVTMSDSGMNFAQINQVADGISKYGVPEWALRPYVSADERKLVVEALEKIVDRYVFRGAVAPLVHVYGVGQLLQADADSILTDRDMSDLEREVAVSRWRNVGVAYQQSISFQKKITTAVADGWIELVKRQAALEFDSSRGPKFTALTAEVQSEAGLRLWQALDAAVLSGSATVDMKAEWAEVVATMRTPPGRPELSAQDFVHAIDSRCGFGPAFVSIRPHLHADGRATREQYKYACRVMGALAEALATSCPNGVPVDQRMALISAINAMRDLKPPLLSPSLRDEGSRVVGQLVAAWTSPATRASTDLEKDR